MFGSSNASQAISQLDTTINTFKSRVDVKVIDVQESTNSVRGVSDRLYSSIERLRTEMMQGEQTQIAHENILRIDQIIEEQFSNYHTIRRTVMGIVRDFDINLVRNSTIQELSEELWITSSRYWLSYALLAITAWVNDYPEIARNALAESGRKDAIKTTLFFCLLNLRFGRMDAAKKWFYQYLKTLDPNYLQQESAILLRSFLNGVFGKDKQLEQEVVDLINEWIAVIQDNEVVSNELIDDYERFISYINPSAEFNYESILAFCVNVDELKQSFVNVSKFEMLLNFVRSLDVEAEKQDESNYKDRIDSILIDLISNYDAEELELKKQQDYYHCIIDSNGELDRAAEKYQAMLDLESDNFNFGKQMLRWAVYDDNEKTDVQVRKFGFQHTKSWFKEAIERFDLNLQMSFPLEYKLRIDKWESVSTGDDYEEQSKSLKSFMENNRIQFALVDTWNILLAILFIASAGLAFIALPKSLFTLIATVISGGLLAYRVVTGLKKYPERIQSALNSLRMCLDEIAIFRRYYDEMHAKKDVLMGVVEFL